MSQRAFYSIKDEVLARFNAVVPPRQRSVIVERLMERHVADQEMRVTDAARLIETHQDFAALREISVEADAFAVEAIARLPRTDAPI